MQHHEPLTVGCHVIADPPRSSHEGPDEQNACPRCAEPGRGGDLHHHEGLAEEESENLLEEELRELIDDLNVDESAELVALAWLGRGDYDASEWSEALTAARERGNKRTSRYLLGMPMLGDWLEEGLEALGA